MERADEGLALSPGRLPKVEVKASSRHHAIVPPERVRYLAEIAATVRDRLSPHVWEDYFKFCVVRNPYEKAVSAFYFWQRAQTGTVVFEGVAREREKFSAWVDGAARLPIDRGNYLIDGRLCVNDRRRKTDGEEKGRGETN